MERVVLPAKAREVLRLPRRSRGAAPSAVLPVAKAGMGVLTFTRTLTVKVVLWMNTMLPRNSTQGCVLLAKEGRWDEDEGAAGTGVETVITRISAPIRTATGGGGGDVGRGAGLVVEWESQQRNLLLLWWRKSPKRRELHPLPYFLCVCPLCWKKRDKNDKNRGAQ